MRKKKSRFAPSPREPVLFDLPPSVPISTEPLIKPPQHPIWSENKARLIERYLYYFILITKHGTYIDGFAGPQSPGKPDTWTAKLVLESQPRRLRKIFLYDRERVQVKRLQDLVQAQPRRQLGESRRSVSIRRGDANTRIPEILRAGEVPRREAAFCLLDQRTFECHWTTLQHLAHYKNTGYKVEIIYFLANFWLGRALAAQKDSAVLSRWWGRDDWTELRTLRRWDRVQRFVERFRNELGYRSVKPWPIFSRENGGSVMYYLIHATDHPDSPGLMARAYDMALLPKESQEQFKLILRQSPD